MSEARRSRTLFWIVLALTAFQYVFLIADRRLPLGHETGTLYGIRFYFMTCAAQSGTPPLWMPFATQGTPSNWAWFEQGGLFQNGLLLAAPLFRGRGFLPLFHLGMFVEELLFLVGVWLLASRHFRSPVTVFFVSVAALGSCLWIDHAAQNLGAIAALPLLLHLLHEFLEKKSRRCLFLAGSLAILQALGKPPALALFIPAAAALYGVGYAVLFKFPLRDRLREISWGRKDLGVGASLLGIALMVGVGAFAGTGELVYAPGERWTFRALLDGAGLGNPLQYFDLLLGLAPSLDATVYCGYFTLAFALVALGGAGLRNSVRLLGFLAGSLIALSLLTLLLGVLLPIPFPSRPPVPGVPLVRLFVIFLAGFGFQAMVDKRQETSPRVRSTGLLLAAGAACLVVLSGIATLFAASGNNHDLAEGICRMMTLQAPANTLSPLPGRTEVFAGFAGTSALMSGLTGGILLLGSGGSRRFSFALGLALFAHPVDVFGWKFRMSWLKTTSLSPPQTATHVLEGIPFRMRRSPDRGSNERYLSHRSPVHPIFDRIDFAYGEDSWLSESFWFADLPESRSPTLYRMRNLDRLSRALRESGSSPAWASGLSGLSRDKLQLFSHISFVESESRLTQALARPGFSGEQLVAQGEPRTPLPPADRDDRLSSGGEISRVEADVLRGTVDAPPGQAGLFYADAWHPGWTATVDGADVPVYRASMAYKAVALPGGRSIVEFRFRSPGRTACAAGTALLSLMWLGWTLRAATLLLSGRRR